MKPNPLFAKKAILVIEKNEPRKVRCTGCGAVTFTKSKAQQVVMPCTISKGAVMLHVDIQ